MEAFELIRRQAAALHDKVVANGTDPLDVWFLVLGAAQARDLDVTFLPKGDPGLKGARALFDDQAGSILCSDGGSDIDRALLVAHEIGHDVLHAEGNACKDEDIDASQSVEAAPVGLQRVEDYGARERRELHANVFARELVLPRVLAAHLYVDQGLSAASIVARTGLPVPLVRQQILDAVLLPTIEGDDGPATAPFVPIKDAAQDRSVVHRNAPFMLEAGPGTGKTRTLVKRIVSLIDENVDPASILVLTFSNRAAGELSERVAAVLGDKAAKIWIGTFHSFGLDLLRRHGEHLGLPNNPGLFDRSDAIAVLEDVLPTMPILHYRNLWDPSLNLREILSAISRAKDEMADNLRYRQLAQAMPRPPDTDTAIHAEKCLEIASVYDRYEAAKSAQGAVDFGDLIMLPAKLMETFPAIAAAIRLRHRHVLVDEYQDVNRASVRLLQGLAGDGKRLWVVGDARQSIYRFRGASSGNMAAFKKDFPGGVSDALEQSYRSTEAIISNFTSFAGAMKASKGLHPLRLRTEKGAGTPTQVREFGSLGDEIGGLAASIAELKQGGVALRDQAVLCRTNKRLNEIAAGLEQRGIPVLHLGSLFEREEVRDLLSIMSLAADNLATGLARIAAMPRYDIPLQDVYHIIRILKERKGSAISWISELAADIRVSEPGRHGLQQLAADLVGLRPGDQPWDFMTTYLLDRTDFLRQSTDSRSVADWMRSCAIWQFLNFLRDAVTVGHGSPIWKTLERIRQMVLLAEERDLRQVPAAALRMDAVRLMTIHGSKGLEFEAVHLPGMTEVSIPSQYRGLRCPPPVDMIADANGMTIDEFARLAHASEEECLAFVAMSRAKRHLRLYLSRTQPNGNGRNSSSFLPHIAGLQWDHGPLIDSAPGSERVGFVDVHFPAEFAVTDTRIGMYMSCPRRYFYTYVLGLGGAKRQTAFTATHQCIYELIDWVHAEQCSRSVDSQEVEAHFEEIWNRSAMPEKPGAGEYRALASRIIDSLLASGQNRIFQQSRSIAVDLEAGRIVVEPDAIAKMADGTMVLRRVRTGHRRKDEYKSTEHIEYGLYVHAGRAEFGVGSIVEAVHLTDDLVEPVDSLSEKVIGNRLSEANRLLAQMNAGDYHADSDAVRCARCPHFFVCEATPSGPLTLESADARSPQSF